METYPDEYKLTDEDIEKTERRIADFDLSREQIILSVIPQKLEFLQREHKGGFGRIRIF